MKMILALSAALAATAYAIPLATNEENPSALFGPESKLDAKINKLQLGGLNFPSAYSQSLASKEAPKNYGNLNQGTGMMPSQVVHYGTENQPDHGYISPTLISTTAKDAMFQVAKAEQARELLNADVDVGKLDYLGKSKFTENELYGDYDYEDEDEDEAAKWGWGWGWGYRRPWWNRNRYW
ncbi:hypothetical protein BG011_001992 [Mortierella polycephala]|uniref:Uncharacterized protein n=1 Tax=Mortierella polycephala TaxID=41804 RepID=A0A9P6U5Q1_9FUNG|nr:hypothetical protein BG011_001992 [Mortierella polycephala]